jgi:anti-sigma-K factor RskA
VEKRLQKSAAVKAAVAGVKRRLKRLDAEYYWPEYGPLPRHLQELIDQLPPGATWHEQALAHKARTESLRKLL